jgi:hypothetical protein
MKLKDFNHYLFSYKLQTNDEALDSQFTKHCITCKNKTNESKSKVGVKLDQK